MTIASIDHLARLRPHRAAIEMAIRRVLDSGKPDWGDEVPAFETAFAAWVGAGHAVTVNSGTAALKIALLALGIGAGDEVITIANTDVCVPSAIRATGAAVVWVDIDPVSKTMDIEALRRAITPRTRAILPVDACGHPSDMSAIGAIAVRHDLKIVEDACVALGAEIGGRRVGSLADVTCFSFGPSKHLGALGTGGACTTGDAALARRIRLLAGYGRENRAHGGPIANGDLHIADGLNERLDEIQAAVLGVLLPDLDRALDRRRHQAALYHKRLAGLPVERPLTRDGDRHAWRSYVVELDDRDAVRRKLAERGIVAGAHYDPPMHLQPVYRPLGFDAGSYPVTERSAARSLSLPIGPHLGVGEISAVCEALRSMLR
jgi:dTDP-4-amino-4,6-dideoxygalactose transaminase